MAVHVRYNSWYISLLSSAKQEPNPALSGERKTHRIFFNIYISNFTPSSTFIFGIAVTGETN